MAEPVAWTRHAIEHMLTRHGISANDTAEALADPSAIWADPDPSSVTAKLPGSWAGHTPGSN